MGIPLFITPVEPEVASKAAEKTSARPRSSIRRLRSVGNPRMSPETRRRRLMGRMADFERPEEYEVVEPYTQGGAPPRDEDVTSMPHPFSSRSAYRSEYERMRLRDQLSFERQRTVTSENDGPLLPPAPESEDIQTRLEAVRQMQRRERENYSLAEARRRQDLRRLARRRTAPTPPYVEGESNYPARSHRADLEERRSILIPARSSSRSGLSYIDLTPEDAYRSDSSARPTPVGRTISERIAALNRARETFEAADRDALAERVAALNRATDSFEAGRRARQARLDGLGDRDRSLSPEGATWDTLLSGITPDPQPPSAGSSFASSAAAAASSGPASANTSLTSLDAVSANDSAHPNANDFCEISDSASADEEDEEEEDMFELREYNRPSQNTGRSYANALLADRVARYNHSTDTEHWEGMQLIISRLTEREDIPDSWWASAGLSRNLRREPST